MNLQILTICVFCAFNIFLINEVNTQRDGPYTTRTNVRMKQKIFKLNEELVQDAYSRVQAIQNIKMFYESAEGYRNAQAAYLIRRKYVRMMYIYFRSIETLQNVHHTHAMLNLTEIQNLYLDIDNLVHAMESWDDVYSRKKRITRMKEERMGVGRLGLVEEIGDIKTEQEKQKDYLKRKKIEWRLFYSEPGSSYKWEDFIRKDNVMEGFLTDVDDPSQ